jgi:hypothetical protein
MIEIPGVGIEARVRVRFFHPGSEILPGAQAANARAL